MKTQLRTIEKCFTEEISPRRRKLMVAEKSLKGKHLHDTKRVAAIIDEANAETIPVVEQKFAQLTEFAQLVAESIAAIEDNLDTVKSNLRYIKAEGDGPKSKRDWQSPRYKTRVTTWENCVNELEMEDGSDLYGTRNLQHYREIAAHLSDSHLLSLRAKLVFKKFELNRSDDFHVLLDQAIELYQDVGFDLRKQALSPEGIADPQLAQQFDNLGQFLQMTMNAPMITRTLLNDVQARRKVDPYYVSNTLPSHLSKPRIGEDPKQFKKRRIGQHLQAWLHGVTLKVNARDATQEWKYKEAVEYFEKQNPNREQMSDEAKAFFDAYILPVYQESYEKLQRNQSHQFVTRDQEILQIGINDYVNRIQYYDDEARLRFRKFFHNGRLYQRDLDNDDPFAIKPACTIESSSKAVAGMAALVVNGRGEFYVGSHISNYFDGPEQSEYQFHSAYMQGGDVFFAGEIQTDDEGYLTILTNNSGHYQPTIEHFFYFYLFLRDKGVDLSRCKFRITDYANGQKIELTEASLYEYYAARKLQQQDYDELKNLINKGILTKENVANLFMHAATWAAPEEIMQFLIESGFDINYVDQNGAMPLQIAAELKHWKIVDLLLELGADATLKNNEGLTALEIARQGGYEPELEDELGSSVKLQVTDTQYSAINIGGGLTSNATAGNVRMHASQGEDEAGSAEEQIEEIVSHETEEQTGQLYGSFDQVRSGDEDEDLESPSQTSEQLYGAMSQDASNNAAAGQQRSPVLELLASIKSQANDDIADTSRAHVEQEYEEEAADDYGALDLSENPETEPPERDSAEQEVAARDFRDASYVSLSEEQARAAQSTRTDVPSAANEDNTQASRDNMSQALNNVRLTIESDRRQRREADPGSEEESVAYTDLPKAKLPEEESAKYVDLPETEVPDSSEPHHGPYDAEAIANIETELSHVANDIEQLATRLSEDDVGHHVKQNAAFASRLQIFIIDVITRYLQQLNENLVQLTSNIPDIDPSDSINTQNYQDKFINVAIIADRQVKLNEQQRMLTQVLALWKQFIPNPDLEDSLHDQLLMRDKLITKRLEDLSDKMQGYHQRWQQFRDCNHQLLDENIKLVQQHEQALEKSQQQLSGISKQSNFNHNAIQGILKVSKQSPRFWGLTKQQKKLLPDLPAYLLGLEINIQQREAELTELETELALTENQLAMLSDANLASQYDEQSPLAALVSFDREQLQRHHSKQMAAVQQHKQKFAKQRERLVEAKTWLYQQSLTRQHIKDVAQQLRGYEEFVKQEQQAILKCKMIMEQQDQAAAMPRSFTERVQKQLQAVKQYKKRLQELQFTLPEDVTEEIIVKHSLSRSQQQAIAVMYKRADELLTILADQEHYWLEILAQQMSLRAEEREIVARQTRPASVSSAQQHTWPPASHTSRPARVRGFLNTRQLNPLTEMERPSGNVHDGKNYIANGLFYTKKTTPVGVELNYIDPTKGRVPIIEAEARKHTFFNQRQLIEKMCLDNYLDVTEPRQKEIVVEGDARLVRETCIVLSAIGMTPYLTDDKKFEPSIEDNVAIQARREQLEEQGILEKDQAEVDIMDQVLLASRYYRPH